MVEKKRITASLSPFSSIEALGRSWRQLEERAACSFFQSWNWIGTWLSLLPQSVQVYVLEVVEGDRVIGLGLFGARRVARHGFVRSRALFLHETGSAEFDRLTIEYNSLLAETGREGEVIIAGLQCLKDANVRWDELFVSGVEAQTLAAWDAARRVARCQLVVGKRSTCYFVDLDPIRANGGDYLGLLSSNTRRQIRQSIKAYEKFGKLTLSVAPSAEAAVGYLHGLRTLHDAHWHSQGEAGAFSSPFTQDFHERLVRNGVPGAEVQMLRVTAGEEVVGYLYNLVKDRHVYFYQSGLKYAEDAKLRPGLVCHYLAVMHNVETGNRIYDFLAGPQRYKQSLGSASVEMYWFALQRPRLGFAVERFLKRLKHRIRRGDG